tara:strand:- start:126 stop:326 length:201 start_codon:yes stop_codon:yes gene_type:complete
MTDPKRKIQAVINRLEDERRAYKYNMNKIVGVNTQYHTGVIKGLDIAIDRLRLLINKVTDDSDRKE